jgi:hypothetical protein
VFSLGLGALLLTHNTHAADHLDAPGAAANPLADITDVYAWMNSDASKVNLIMNVSPGDPPQSGGTARHFSPSVLYVFHVTSLPGFGMPGTETKIVCKFASDTSGQCWVGASADYVTGDPSATTGITSASGKVKLYAGHRSDPFFFNLQGFRDTVAAVDAAEMGGGLTADAAGCPNLLPATAATLRGLLQEGPQAAAAAPCPTTNADCFANLNVMSIVLQVDKSLLNVGANNVLSVWASTHSPQ